LGEVRELRRESLAMDLVECDAVVAYGAPMSVDELETAGRLKVISCHSCPRELRSAAADRGIVVYEVSTLWETVADLTAGLVLAVARQIPQADAAVRQGQWSRADLKVRFSGRDVFGRTLGIVGLGRIGALLARRMSGFGMRMLYHDIRRQPDLESAFGLRFARLTEVVAAADFLVVLVPLNDSTRGLMDDAMFQLMKPDAFFINTSRGAVVDEDALIRALRSRRIAGAALDVFTREPLASDSPLLELSNVVLTPHLGGSTMDSDMALVEAVRRRLRD
jgi:phosphoglycerate dehydrogenase-like enzyme